MVFLYQHPSFAQRLYCKFIDQFKLADTLHTEYISENHLQNLEALLPDAVQAVSAHMSGVQSELEKNMALKLGTYRIRMEAWKAAAYQQLELDFNEQSGSNLWVRIKDSKQREIETILSTSSQYYKDITSLRGEAWLKVLAVFYNQSDSKSSV